VHEGATVALVGTSRKLIALVITSIAAPLCALLVATLAGRLDGFAPLSFAAAAMGLPMLLPDRRLATALVGVLAGVAALAWGGVAAALVAALVHAVGVPLLARRMPELPRGARAWLWGVLALLTVGNSARLTVFMADAEATWGAPAPFIPDSARHSCMSAFVRAGELAPHVDNVYDPEPYQVGSESRVTGLAPKLGDPYEYPPPFLLLPRAGLALSSDYAHLRAGWYALQALLIGAMLLAITAWTRDARAGLLLPVVWLSAPLMFNFQYGQVHLLIIVAGVAAMAAFHARRDVLGGALLGVSVIIKLFPGLLLVYLAARRRWRALAWTAAAMLVYTLLALALLGPTPFVAFVTKQLPRLHSGEAFAFFENDPPVIANNLSIYGLVFKLDLLGVGGMTRQVACQVAWIYTALLLVLAWRIGRRPGVEVEDDRSADVRTWLGLLNLAAMRSPLAPATYVAASMVWMLVLVAASARRRPGWTGSKTFLAWLFAAGGPTLGSPALTVLAGLPTQVIYVVVNAWPLRRRSK